MDKKAFTLVEILVVLTIIALFLSISFFNFSWASDKAKNTQVKSDVSSIQTAMESYYLEKSHLPESQNYSSFYYPYSWNNYHIIGNWNLSDSFSESALTEPFFDKKYTYAKTLNLDYFELAWVLKNDKWQYYTYISWNYNSFWFFTPLWASQKAFFALPSLVFADNSSLDLNALSQQSLAFNNSFNLPFDFYDWQAFERVESLSFLQDGADWDSFPDFVIWQAWNYPDFATSDLSTFSTSLKNIYADSPVSAKNSEKYKDIYILSWSDLEEYVENLVK